MDTGSGESGGIKMQKKMLAVMLIMAMLVTGLTGTKSAVAANSVKRNTKFTTVEYGGQDYLVSGLPYGS